MCIRIRLGLVKQNLYKLLHTLSGAIQAPVATIVLYLAVSSSTRWGCNCEQSHRTFRMAIEFTRLSFSSSLTGGMDTVLNSPDTSGTLWVLDWGGWDTLWSESYIVMASNTETKVHEWQYPSLFIRNSKSGSVEYSTNNCADQVLNLSKHTIF